MESKNYSSNYKKLNILFLLQYFVPAWSFGGIVRLTYNISLKLIEKGHNVTILTSDALDKNTRIKEKTKIIDGIRVIYFRNISNIISSRYKISNPLLLKRFLKNNIKNYDICHIQDIYFLATKWAAKFAIKNKIPFIISPSGVLSSYPQQNKKYLKKIANFYLRDAILKADAIIAATESEFKDLDEFGSKNIRLINMAIDLKPYKKKVSNIIMRRKLNINSDDFLILFVGRINEIKGIYYLLKAVIELNDPKIKLIIIGPDDNYLDILKKKINLKNNNSIFFQGWVSEKEKLEAFSAADIFCLPSIYDCAPNCILEACAFGVPFIITSSSGLSEIARSGSGIVVEPRNVIEIKKAICFLRKNRDKFDNMGKIGKNIVEIKHNWDFVIKQLIDLYFELKMK